MKACDCHCHLDFNQYDEDREELLNQIFDELEFIVLPGVGPDSNQKVADIAAENRKVRFNIGLHPTHVDDFERIDHVIDQIEELNPCAVGEIGLDHHHVTDKHDKKRQEKVFRNLLQVAENKNLPVNVHSRDAERKTVEILKEYSLPGVMVHCFNGKPGLAAEIVEEGFFVGVTTQVLYSERVQKIVEKISLDSILLETDSPFLYPNERNTPLNVYESAEKIAEIKDCSTATVIENTTQNAEEVFGR